MTTRREVITGLGGTALAWPLADRALAQKPPGKVHRVGLLFATVPAAELAGPEPINPLVKAFVHGLRDLGYVEGRNLVLERRSAEGRLERYDEILTELVARKADVIVTIGNDMTLAAKRVTTTVPIVMAGSTDPVEAGIVASLARPGGNVTGLTFNTGPGFEAKRLQLLNQRTNRKYSPPRSRMASTMGFMVKAASPVTTAPHERQRLELLHRLDAFAAVGRHLEGTDGGRQLGRERMQHVDPGWLELIVARLLAPPPRPAAPTARGRGTTADDGRLIRLIDATVVCARPANQRVRTAASGAFMRASICRTTASPSASAPSS
jgi:ABC transporter substrate binding protein